MPIRRRIINGCLSYPNWTLPIQEVHQQCYIDEGWILPLYANVVVALAAAFTPLSALRIYDVFQKVTPKTTALEATDIALVIIPNKVIMYQYRLRVAV